jgi:hypothetical protein
MTVAIKGRAMHYCQSFRGAISAVLIMVIDLEFDINKNSRIRMWQFLGFKTLLPTSLLV